MLVHVEQGYAQNGNPYHNHMHACDVLQTVHYFISQTGLAVSTKKLFLKVVINLFQASTLESEANFGTGPSTWAMYCTGQACM